MFALALMAEEADERVVAADDERRAGGGEQHARPEIDVGQQAQRLVEPRRHVDRPQRDQLLHRPQRADGGAERPAEEQREHDRQREQRRPRSRASRSADRTAASVTFWIAPIGQMQPSRQKPSQASDTMVSTNSPRRERLTMAKYDASASADRQRRQIEILEQLGPRRRRRWSTGSAWSVKSGGGNRSAAIACETASGSSRPVQNRQCPRSERLIPCCSRIFQQVRLVGRHAAERLRGAGHGDRALVAVLAAVVPHLQVERAVAEGVAALHALAAADAQPLVDRVLEVRVFDERPPDGPGRAKLVLGAGVQRDRLGLEVAGAEIAVAAHREAVDALDGRFVQHAVRGAVAAGDALARIDLPDQLAGCGPFARPARPTAPPMPTAPATRRASPRNARRSRFWFFGRSCD